MQRAASITGRQKSSLRPKAAIDSEARALDARRKEADRSDGHALFSAVCELGFEGVVAKNHSSLYRPGDRGWVKVKNPNYWRRDAELEAMQRAVERRTRRLQAHSVNG